MKTPDREPRNEPSLENYTYYDHQVVVQDDGRFAKFTWNNKERNKGWQFSHWEDQAGFNIFEDKDIKTAHLLIDSEIPLWSHLDKSDFPLISNLLDDSEQLHEFKYGGVMSGRGGFYITPKNAPGNVLRALWVWMS